MRRSLVPVLLAAVLALAACAPTPLAPTTLSAPTSKPTATPSTTPTVTAAPTPAPVVAPTVALASISATSEGLTLVGTDGSTLASLDYFQPKDAAIAALTGALGFAPQELSKQGTPNSDHLASNYFDFEGLQVLGPPGDSSAGWQFRINTVVGSVRGIPVVTVDGLQVGASAPDLESSYSAYARRIGARLLIAIPGPSGYGVSLFADDPTTVITSILAPTG